MPMPKGRTQPSRAIAGHERVRRQIEPLHRQVG
jgi:hypothetical protein